ncbi:hypothetical protein HN51_007455 [Arachis hypogaea]
MEGLIPYIIDAIRDKKQKPKRSLSRSDSYRLLLGSDSFGSSEFWGQQPHNHTLAVATPRGRSKGTPLASIPNDAPNASQYHHPLNNIRKRYPQSSSS